MRYIRLALDGSRVLDTYEWVVISFGLKKVGHKLYFTIVLALSLSQWNAIKLSIFTPLVFFKASRWENEEKKSELWTHNLSLPLLTFTVIMQSLESAKSTFARDEERGIYYRNKENELIVQ